MRASQCVRDVTGEESAESTPPAPFVGRGWALASLEHKRLDELLLQSLLRLDAITPDGSWEEARRERKSAVKEVQGLLNKLDAGWKSLPQ